MVTGNLSEVHDNLRGWPNSSARALDDRPRLAHVYLSQAIALVNQGAMDQVLRSSQQAYEIARETHDMPVMIGAQFNMALAHFTLGNLKKSVELFAPFVETLTRDFRYEWSQVTTGTLSPIYLSMFGSSGAAQLGEFGSARWRTRRKRARSPRKPGEPMTSLSRTDTMDLSISNAETVLLRLARCGADSRSAAIMN